MPDQLFEDAPEPDAEGDDEHDVFYDAPESSEHDDGEDGEDSPNASAGAGPSADVLVEALFQAGPEAAEHLLKAAQELLLAAKAVVDAGERMLEQHRDTGDDGEAADEEPRVRRIELA